MDPGKSPLEASEGPSRRSGTLKELCFDDKQKVANIIKQVVSLKEDADRNQKIRKEEHLDFQRRLKEMNDRNKEVIRENASLKSKLLQALAMVRTYQHKVRAIEVSQRLKQSNEVTDQVSMPKLPPMRGSSKKMPNPPDCGLEVIVEGGNGGGAQTQSADTACQTSPDIQPGQASDSKTLVNETRESKDVTSRKNAGKFDDERRINSSVQTDCMDSTEMGTRSTATNANLEFERRSVTSDGTVSDATLSGFSSELTKCSAVDSECDSDTTSLLGDIIKRRLKQKKALADTSNRLDAPGGSPVSIASQTRAPREKSVDVKMLSCGSSISSDGSLPYDSDVEASKPTMSFDPGAGPKGLFYLKPEVSKTDEEINPEGAGGVRTKHISPAQPLSIPPKIEDGHKGNREGDQKGVPQILTSPIKDSLPTGSTSSDIHVHHHVHISPSPPPTASGMQVEHIEDHVDDRRGPSLHGIASQKGSQFDASLMDLVSEVEDLLDNGDPTQSHMSRRMNLPSYQSASLGDELIDEADLIRALLLQDM